MDLWDRATTLRHIMAALGRGVFVALLLPLLPVILFGVPLMPTLALIGSGIVFEYGAAPVGITFGLSPLVVFYVLMCTETGVFLGLFDIFDTLGHSYAPAARFLEGTKEFIHRHALAERYGILGLIPCEIIVGVYANAPVAWVLGWNEYKSLVITMAAYVLCLIITILATMGLLQMYFPGLVHP